MPLLLGVTLWSVVVVNAVAPFLPVGGQQAIGPTRAEVLYASQPLWSQDVTISGMAGSAMQQQRIGTFYGSSDHSA